MFILLWSIAGYPLLASTASLFQIDSSGISILIRGLVAMISLFLILANLPRRLNVAFLFFTMFWLAYFSRLTYNLGLKNEVLSRSSLDFWIWSVGACALPALAMLLSTKSSLKMLFFKPITLACGIASLITYLSITTLTDDTLIITSERWQSSNLNPISIGHLGVSTILCGLIGLLSVNSDRIKRVLYFLLIALGLLLSTKANSRGPIVALVLVLLIYIFAQRVSINLLHRIGGLILLTLLIVYIIPSDFISVTNIIYRFSVVSTDSDMSSYMRILSFNGALDQFINSPIFGDGLEEKVTHFYPHNLILEALMTTGIIGGFPFVALLLIGVFSAVRLMRQKTGESLVGALAIQQVIAGQFSGAIYNSIGFWCLICLVISIDHIILRQRNLLFLTKFPKITPADSKL